MASTRDKKHSDPEVDFGDLIDDSTGEFVRRPQSPSKPDPRSPHLAPTAPPPAPASPPRRSTHPTPPGAPFDAWATPRGGVRPPQPEDLALRAPAANRISPAALAALSLDEDEDEHSADEELFGRGVEPERSARRAPDQAAGRNATQPGAVAPPPPRLPELPSAPPLAMPDAEFSIGLPAPDDDGIPAVLGGADDWGDVAAPPLELADPVVGEPGDAHSLVERANSIPPPAPASANPERELRERFALGDFSGALVVAESLLLDRPDHPEAVRVASECRAKLQAMYLSRLGPVDQVPTLALPRSELKWLSLDHRAGFVLSLVDGSSSIEEIIDVAGMPMLEVLRVLFDLHNQRAIEFRARGRAR